MASLPLTLAARLLPTALLAAVGWSMVSAATPAQSNDRTPPAASNPSVQSALRVYARPPAACSALPTATVTALVPGAATAGAPLALSDPDRRTGCSWHALKDFDYRWLDVSFDVSQATPRASAAKTATELAQETYTKSRRSTPLTGLGDEASVGDELTTEDGQQLRQAVVVARLTNAVITVTYNGGDFDSGKAPAADGIRQGAITAARAALTALGTPGTAGTAGTAGTG